MIHMIYQRGSLVRLLALLMALLVLATACDGGGADQTGDGDGADGTTTSQSGSDTTSQSGSDTTLAGANRIVVAMAAEPDDLSPYTVTVDDTSFQVYETLTDYDHDTQIVPRLAEALATPIDDLTWEIPIREGVTFHDGTPLTAQVVADAFDLLVGREDSAMRTRLGSGWGGVEAVDEMTLRINLESPNPLLNQILANILIVQPDNHQPNHPVGTGPYEFVEWNRGQSIVLERFPDYWGEEPEVDRVEYRSIPDASSQLAAFLAGEVDVLRDITPNDADQLPEQSIETVQGGDMHLLIPNVRDGITADVRVRQAMNYAIDRDLLNQQIFNGLGVIEPCQPLHPGFVGFNPDLEPYPYDPDRARELIADAGAEGAELELVGPQGSWPGDREQTEAIAAMFSDVGLNATVRIIGLFDAYIDELLSQPERPAVIWGNRSANVLDGSNLQLYFWEPGAEAASGSSVPEDVAAQFTNVLGITDLEDRDAAWREFFADVCEQAYIVNLISPPAFWAHSDSIEALNPLPVVQSAQSRIADISLASMD